MDEYISRKLKVLSFVSMIMVVFVHAYNLKDRFLLPQSLVPEPRGVASFIEYFVSNGLARFAVPFFFAASGYLFFHGLQPVARVFSDKLLRRLRSLLLPYVLWNGLGTALVFVTQDHPLLNPSRIRWVRVSEHDQVGRELFWLFLHPLPFQLWFVRDLMVYALLSPLLYWLTARLSFWLLAPLGIIWFLHLPMAIVEPEGLLFFVLGGILAIHRVNLRSQLTGAAGRAIAWLLPLDLALITLKTLLAHRPDPGATLLLSLHKVSILCGVFGVWYAYDGFGERLHQSLLLRLAPFTFFIYLAHEPLMIILTDATLLQLGSTGPILLAVYLCAPAVVLSVCLLLGVALRRWAPLVFHTLTGGRG